MANDHRDGLTLEQRIALDRLHEAFPGGILLVSAEAGKVLAERIAPASLEYAFGLVTEIVSKKLFQQAQAMRAASNVVVPGPGAGGVGQGGNRPAVDPSSIRKLRGEG